MEGNKLYTTKKYIHSVLQHHHYAIIIVIHIVFILRKNSIYPVYKSVVPSKIQKFVSFSSSSIYLQLYSNYIVKMLCNNCRMVFQVFGVVRRIESIQKYIRLFSYFALFLYQYIFINIYFINSISCNVFVVSGHTLRRLKGVSVLGQFSCEL